jgi:23S rRNA pseudouridine1911/1915/1917 synthase
LAPTRSRERARGRRQGDALRRGRRRRDLAVVYEDESIIVIDKAAGILTVPLERNPGVPSVAEQLVERFRSHGKRRPFVVHRIDQDSSGLVVFAKDARAQKVLVDQFRRREPERVYLAVLHGELVPPSGTWRDRLVWDERALIQKAARPGERDSEEAVSEYRVVERLRGASLVEVRLKTGRRNQIRIQAALRGHPLVGERRYVSPGATSGTVPFRRQALHAWRLTFRHPRDETAIDLEAPIPRDISDLLVRLRR